MIIEVIMNETINQSVNITHEIIKNGGINNLIPFTGSIIIDIYLISLIVSLFITLVNKYFLDQVKIKALKAEMQELRKKQREYMRKRIENKGLYTISQMTEKYDLAIKTINNHI